VKEALPLEIERFLSDHIDSVEAINVLILLFAHPSRRWTVEDVGHESRTNGWSAEMHLRALSEHGLVRVSSATPPTYQADPAYTGIVSLLARTFLERRVSVISFIYSRPEGGKAG
jgi:hypothetical protein